MDDRDDLTLRGILAAQENLKAREAAQRPASRAFFFPCICQDPLADSLTHAQSLNESSGVGQGRFVARPLVGNGCWRLCVSFGGYGEGGAGGHVAGISAEGPLLLA
mgnify:FL=1